MCAWILSTVGIGMYVVVVMVVMLVVVDGSWPSPNELRSA